MGLFKKIKKQLLAVIEWKDDTKNTIVYRYPLTDRDEIMNSSTLVVRPSQVAVFVHKGEICDVFAPGTYKLTTENIPFLTKILSLPTDFNSPIKAEVYFVNTKQITAQKWGTQNPVIMRDAEFGNVRIRAFGIYSYKVADPKVFMEEIFGTNELYTSDDICEYLRPFIVQGVSDTIAESKSSVLDIAANYKEFSKEITDHTQETFENIGLKLCSLVIENVSLPEEVEKTLDERTKLGVMEDKTSTYTRLQAAESLKEAAKNPNGGNLAGLGVGLGAGAGLGRVFSDNLETEAAEAKAMVKCIKCGAKITKGSKFCPECGTKQQLVCPKCGAEITPNTKFCPECGEKINK